MENNCTAARSLGRQHVECRVVQGEVRCHQRVRSGPLVRPRPNVPHLGSPGEAEVRRKRNGKGTVRLAVVVDDKGSDLTTVERLGPQLQPRVLLGATNVPHEATGVPGPGLVHGDSFSVGNNGPEPVSQLLIQQVVPQYERCRNHAPRPEMRAVLRGGCKTTHLEHVRVRPGPGAGHRRVAREGEHGLEVGKHGGPARLDVLGGAVETVGALRHRLGADTRTILLSRVELGTDVHGACPVEGTGCRRCGAPPVAVFDEHRLAGSVQHLCPQREVQELAAAVKLDPVEPELHDGLDRLVHVGHVLVGPFGSPQFLLAKAVVHIPSGVQAQGVCLVGHTPHVRELGGVDYGGAIRFVEGLGGEVVVDAGLPSVIKPTVVVAYVHQTPHFIVHNPLASGHSLHYRLHLLLGYVEPIAIPRPPAHGWCEGEAVVQRRRGSQQTT
eukprot:Hpha_TRINITY_DN15358_c4_g5::TRINITY_DN15358_c4_g5_i1::g.87463::m.87463